MQYKKALDGLLQYAFRLAEGGQKEVVNLIQSSLSVIEDLDKEQLLKVTKLLMNSATTHPDKAIEELESVDLDPWAAISQKDHKWPEACRTCGEEYVKDGFSVCSNSFHCCRDCTWLHGKVTEYCEAHKNREEDIKRAEDISTWMASNEGKQALREAKEKADATIKQLTQARRPWKDREYGLGDDS